MNKKLIWILFIILVCIGVALRFSTSHETMPIGCDEFGYLNQAKAMDQGITFEQHTSRPYLSKLLDTLRTSGITEFEIAWMVTPHAYHVIPETNKIINQYPPATAFVMQFFPFEIRKILFPSIALFILILFSVFAIWKVNKNSLNWFHPLFAIYIFILTVSAPFLTELTRVNSLAFTFGFLTAAGILLRKYPLWSCFLIALTINFRVANVLLLLPVFFFTQTSLRQLFTVKNILSFGLISVLSILPLLIYNYSVVGNPFSSTYSAIDQSFSNSVTAISAFKYYFSFDQYWLRVHLIAILLLLVFVALTKLSFVDFLKLLLFPTLNYLFFIFHSVNMDYYPYASAIFLTGIIFQQIAEIKLPEKFTNVIYGIICLVGVIIAGSGLSRYLKRTHMTFSEAKNQYKTLCDFDIVWADLYSGTSEYVCNNNGFRYGTTTPRARKLALLFLQSNHYKQAILLDDNTVPAREILEEVKSIGLSFEKASDPKLGNFIIIN